MNDTHWKRVFRSIHRMDDQFLIKSFVDAGLNIANKNGRTILSEAVRSGNLEVVEFLVKKGADYNMTNSDGSNPLHVAVKHGNKKIAKFFLGLGIFVDSRDAHNNTPLHYVAFKRSPPGPFTTRDGYQELVHFLLNSDADLDAVNDGGCTPLLLAAENSYKELVELFIRLGANVHSCDEAQRTVLHHCCWNGWSGIVRSLVEGDFDIDLNAKTSGSDTPLTIVCENSHKDIIKLLIDSGADVICCNKNKMTALHLACRPGMFDVVHSLVSKGCKINTKSSFGHTPLFLAVMTENLQVAKYLVDSGADVNCCDNSKRTLLHLVCEDRRLYISKPAKLETIKLLLNAGADCNVQDAYDTSAFGYFLASPICLEGIEVFLEKSAYFQYKDYIKITDDSLLKKGVLQDLKLCTLALLNKFNVELLKIYKIPVLSKYLPPVEKLKNIINNAEHDIAQSVKYDIQTNGYCNVLKMRPVTLAILSVESLVKYYCI